MFKKIKNTLSTQAGSVVLIATSFFLLVCLLGEGPLMGWASNKECYVYLGCTNGFFGYDAIEHFLFGIVGILTLVWIFKRFTRFSFEQNRRWKNALILLSLTLSIALLWEFIEFVYDIVHVEILHVPLFNFKLHINLLAQPSNFDTIGDFAFCTLGAISTLFFVDLDKKSIPKDM